jgi:CRP/FNR family transcriptional regulator
LVAIASAVSDEERIQDSSARLPSSTVETFRARAVIYSHDQPCDKLFLVVEGNVKVSRLGDGEQPVVVDIYQQSEFFGESAMLDLPRRFEEASALDTTKVMTWTAAEVHDMVLERPRLGLALTQIFVQRTIDMARRIESFSLDNIPRRLARSLIRYAGRMGKVNDDGAVWMPPLTHELLGQIVGTSREIITHYMAIFRRQGYVRYSRSGITLYRDSLLNWLEQPLAEARRPERDHAAA